MNKGISKRNKSGKKGVHWAKQQNKWCASIGWNNKRKNLGYFDSLEDAITTRIEAEQKLFKEFNPINESRLKNEIN
jgi:hypothetical protein